MLRSPDSVWDPADTDGQSEDWLDRLVAMSQTNDVLRTPIGVIFTGARQLEQLFSHPALKVPVVEQYQLMGVTDDILQRAERVILGMDGAPHARLRRLVSRAFTRRAVDKLTDTMRTYLETRLDDLSGPVDFLEDIVGRYPAAIIGGLLGLPDSDLPYLTTIAERVASSQFSIDVQRVQNYLVAAAECDAYLGELVAAKRRFPTDDILTQLTMVDVDGDRLTDAEIISLCASLMIAGIDTTRNQASLGMLLFSGQPDQWQLLRADPTRAGNAVEEILRCRPATAMLTRLTTEAITFDGVEMAEGTLITLGVAVANRDRYLNPHDPDKFDITRKSPRHFTFGHGAHFCVGAALARLELRELLTQLASRFSRADVIGETPRRPVLGVYGVNSMTLHLER